MIGALPRVEEYRRRRRQYYARFPDFWATFPGGTEAEEEYAVYGAVEVRREDVAAIRLASDRLMRVMSKVVAWAQVSPDDLLRRMGIPAGALDYARLSIPGMPPTVIGRFEYAMTEGGPKLLELNAETPTLVVELFRMNGQVCRDFGLEDPNAGCADQLRDALQEAIAAGLGPRRGSRRPRHVVFTSFGGHQEDRGTVTYLLGLLPRTRFYTVSYCPLEELRVMADRLEDRDGRPIDVLYKLYPTEHLIEDQAPDHVPVGRMVMGLVAAGRLAVINPPVSFLLQCKGLVALLWGLHEAAADIFDRDEHDWIEAHVLPTYLDPADESGRPVFPGAYVAKPVYGREGDSISIRCGAALLEAHPSTTYADQTYVYQQCASLPRMSLLTEKGQRDLNVVFSCFVVGGHASAVGMRAGPARILDDNAYFVPLCYGGIH
ncbi:MAG: glutathionylspermidine synthase family protein [Chloroflexi bacterium]|nr:glutathionylspermidine synthase family protein [Chloroflexota bacterium]